MDIAEAVSVFFLGAIILAPVAALSARFAMKPVISLFNRRFATEELAASVADQARRIDLLESELASLNEAMRSLSAASEFQRQLAAANGELDAKQEPA